MLNISMNLHIYTALEKILIPSMLIQIHTENAVEKGIRNRLGAHELSISITEEQENVIISIRDDGQGRKDMNNLNENRKGSTEVMNELISVLNAYNSNKITVTYEDHIIEGKYGTQVKIKLPKNFNYEFEKI